MSAVLLNSGREFAGSVQRAVPSNCIACSHRVERYRCCKVRLHLATVFVRGDPPIRTSARSSDAPGLLATLLVDVTLKAYDLIALGQTVVALLAYALAFAEHEGVMNYCHPRPFTRLHDWLR